MREESEKECCEGTWIVREAWVLGDVMGRCENFETSGWVRVRVMHVGQCTHHTRCTENQTWLLHVLLFSAACVVGRVDSRD